MMKTFHRTLGLLLSLALAGCGSGECYVGVSGTEASITVKDMFPQETCDALIKNPEAYIGRIAQDSPKEFYAMSERPAQPVVCEHEVEGRRFIVRDDGMLKLVGNILCSGLSKRAEAAESR